MKIAILVEGQTEDAFKRHLLHFLQTHLTNQMPKLVMVRCDGRIPKGKELKQQVEKLLTGQKPVDAVIALTDVYTGSDDFIDAADAKQKNDPLGGQSFKVLSTCRPI
jgi:hypothetical protein